ncbi:hypothetical protein Tco_0732501 [Tanacetum coccineum]
MLFHAVPFDWERSVRTSENCAPKPKSIKRDDQWFKEKVLLVQAQAHGQILNEEELAFLADPDIPEEETLALAEESRSKMLSKHKDNMMLEKEKQVDTTPIDYVALNKDFSTRFIPQTELSAKQAFWAIEFCAEVNTSLKKLKYHLANFDVVVKERTTPTAIAEVKMNQVLNKIERLLEQVMSKDIVNSLVNPSMENDPVNVHACQKCLKLETELQTDFVKRETYNKLSNEKALAITALKDELRKLKGKSLVDNNVSNHPSDPDEEAAVLRDLVDHIKANYPLGHPLRICLFIQICSSGIWDSAAPKHRTRTLQSSNFVSNFLVGKSTKKPHKPKSEDTNQEKLYLVHMDLCGPMRVTSVNEKKTRAKPSSSQRLYNFAIGWDMLQFQLLFDEFLNPSPSVGHPAPEVVAPSNKVIAPVLATQLVHLH